MALFSIESILQGTPGRDKITFEHKKIDWIINDQAVINLDQVMY